MNMNIIISSAIVAIAAIIGYASYKLLGPNNQVEETCETVIKDVSGADVELGSGPTGATATTSTTGTTGTSATGATAATPTTTK